MITAVKQHVTDSSHVAEARRTAAAIASEAGFDEQETGRLTLLVSEGATNLLKHGGGGNILLSVVPERTADGGPLTVQAVFVDKGPGIPDIARAMSDGFSTSGTLGGGLGAMRRAASFFELYTQARRGTVVLCRVRAGGSNGVPPPLMEAEGLSVAMKGEQVCGDGWSAVTHGAVTSVVVADGLGHGPMAHRAAREAMTVWSKDPFRPPAEAMAFMDGALRSTRGAAVAVVRLNASLGQVAFAGVGNIAATIVGGAKPTHCVSMNGTLGQFGRPARTFEYPWTKGAALVMHSDGVGSRWSLDDYPGLLARSAALVSAVLHRDHERGRDDATVVTIKGRPS